MKVSEMTNEELAGAVESIATRRLFAINEEGYLREAAARLRKLDGLNAKLKVAEGALEMCISGMCGECSRRHPHGTCVEGCYEVLTAKEALAAIRKEGGVK